MDILNNLLQRVQSVEAGLKTGQLIGEVLPAYGEDIMQLQREQLFSGKASSGEDIRPYYSEDLQPGGYFQSSESAKRYSVWKEGLPYPYKASRNPDAPNLYINGRFHSELRVEFRPETVGVVPSTSYAEQIVAKYGLDTFGLTSANWEVLLRERGAFEKILENVKNKMYGN